jgi:EAL domain-containing protein (putative c-di-GMP-specific phosphodiesterase class I)
MMPEPGEVDEIFEEMGQKSQMVMAAIENRSVIAHFQPIIDVRSGEVSIHELLMRINDAGRTVPASEFVDIAETLGVIHKLDYILIEMAFEKMRDENYQGVMFINLSPRSLIIGEFIGSVTRMAETYGIDKSKVVFELTERDTVKNLGLLEQFVYNLRSQGFKFAIDDFGSGFSSFHYIKKFPIDYIKVEGEFIKNMVTDSVDRAFVNSIISLAQDLNIKTVGEFVEDAEVMEKVKTSGLDYAQGFYIGRPGPDFRVDNPD